jgi:hypothetical protein
MAGRGHSYRESPKIGTDGTVIRDTAGKVAYTAILEFDSKAVASAFSEAVIAAVLRLDEHALNPVPVEDAIT